jgi:hypothetical protein
MSIHTEALKEMHKPQAEIFLEIILRYLNISYFSTPRQCDWLKLLPLMNAAPVYFLK